MIMTFDLTYKEVISRISAEDFKQWQQWIEDKGICERKECDRCKRYIRTYEKKVLRKNEQVQSKEDQH